MSNRISIEELESYLWGSATLLRTSIDAGAYKQYIFPLLFFKRISDVYDEECEKILEEYDGDESALEWEENHLFMVPKGAHWKDVRAKSENIGAALVDAFSKIQSANPEKLQGVFGDAAWTNKNRLPDRLLKDLIEHFSSKTLSLANCPEDELGQGYEYLIKKFADDSGHTAQEFYTNRTVVHLMTEMLKPQSGESIYDPTCGSAGMLISAIAYLKEKGEEWRNVSVYGQEINALTSAIGKMNLFLHGIKDFTIVNDDTLARPAFIENGELKKFDMVLANPPYSISQWDRDAFSNDKYGRNFLGIPNQNRADFAFVQHILKSMNYTTGRCAILLPHGILNRQEETRMREGMIKRDLVECVIGVGKNLFYNSPMEACILICRSRKSKDREGRVVFIDGREYVTRIGTESFLSKNQIKDISGIYESFVTIEGLSYVADYSEIEDNDFSLAVNRYVRNCILKTDEKLTFSEMVDEWINNVDSLHYETNNLLKLVEGRN